MTIAAITAQVANQAAPTRDSLTAGFACIDSLSPSECLTARVLYASGSVVGGKIFATNHIAKFLPPVASMDAYA